MSEISKQALLVDNSISFPDNNAGAITPSDLRAFNVNVIQSTVNQTEYTENSSSWNSTIDQLNSFTASQQPSFTALNSFTASQLTINSGVNGFTQSASGRLNNIENTTSSLNAWSSSINQILVNGTSIGTSTRFFFNGFVSASIVPNVSGDIASITVLSDPSLVTTASFNAYTASTEAAQTIFSSSVATSLTNLNSQTSSILNSISSLNAYTASDDTSTDALNAFTASQLDINSGFNVFTASQELLSGSFATTGSNIFTGDQTIFKSEGKLLFQSGSSNTAGMKMTSLGNLQLEVQNTQIALLELNTITLQKPTTINGNLTVNGNGSTLGQYANTYIMANGNYSGSQYPGQTIIVAPNIYPTDIFGGLTIATEQGYQNGATFLGAVANSYSPQYFGTTTPMIIANGNNPDGSDTAIAWTSNGHADHWKTSNFKYGLNITGSVYGNVSSSVISSSTASIDLSVANYFTLTLTGDTNINVTNPRPGVTATLVINTDTDATASFSSNVKQPSGSLYVASPSGNVDIISFTAVNSSTVYAFPAQSFV